VNPRHNEDHHRLRNASRRQFLELAGIGAAGLAAAPLFAADTPRRRGRRSQQPRGGPGGVFKTDVPHRLADFIVGRPTRTSMTLSILAHQSCEVALRYCGETDAEPEALDVQPRSIVAGGVAEIQLTNLRPDTAYAYEAWLSPHGGVASSQRGTFHTARSPGSAFTFTVTADSHLDENTEPSIYAATLRNAVADKPDFHIDLGDTFMTGKRRDDPEAALPQYLAQSYYFGLLCHSAPLFLAMGNHDGEFGRGMDAAYRMRTTYFPNPMPDGFYTGSRNENYYAWHWGDALFVVLDPFRYSQRPRRGEDTGNWWFTLGRSQYEWLTETLARSEARFKFVFIHHLVGGRDRQGRGGAEAVPFGEWGGRNLDGANVFASKRPGWELPIHSLLVKHAVTAVFHGHDHFYAKQEVDGIVCQLVPQPGHRGKGSVRCAKDYGYLNGAIVPGSGHLRVCVSGAQTRVDFVRTAGTSGSQIAHTYTSPGRQLGAAP